MVPCGLVDDPSWISGQAVDESSGGKSWSREKSCVNFTFNKFW